jgi:PAS domain S-box-containing protein
MDNDIASVGAATVSSGVERICGSGEMADLIRLRDWSQTSVGAISEWPDALVVLLNMMLANRHPMILFWNGHLTQFYNDAAIPILGPDKHPDSLGQAGDECWAEVWHVVGQQIESARRGQSIWNEDLLAPIYRDGHISDAWFTYSYSPVWDAGGRIAGVLITCLETTSRVLAERSIRTEQERLKAMFTESRHTEDQLREQRERFEFATHAAQIGYWFCNLPFGRLDWDVTVKEHFWLPPDVEVDIDLFYQRLHPDDRERTRLAIEESIGNRGRYDIEYRTVSPVGRQKWIRAIGRTAYDEDGRPLRFDGVTQDVTALRLVREALDAERARLSAVFENVPVGLLFTLADGRIISVNRQAERILGRSFLPESGETYRDLHVLHADGSRVDVGDRPLTLALAEGGFHRGEYQYVRPDGTTIWVEMIGAPILDAQGKIIGAVDAIADIDVRKRAETALIRSEKLALVGRLAASISHEINNPLESVTNLLYLIENNTQDATARKFSRMAQDELARVSHIVTHTLRFNRQTVALGEQKMSGLLESSVAIYEGRLKNSGVALDRDYADTSQVFCSGSEIRQVFANVVGNSFDATKTGGRLVLRTRDQPNWRTGQPGVRVTIADSGLGIPAGVRRRLFEPFFTTKGDNGTGLGLWVSREIVVKHHARMRVKSRQGETSGTVFSIWFPLDAAGHRAPEQVGASSHRRT